MLSSSMLTDTMNDQQDQIKNLGTLVDSFEKRGEKTAIIIKEHKISYEDLYHKATDLSKSLERLGVERGDHIAVWMPNNRFFHQVFFAITSLGAVMVPINTRYKPHELKYILNDSDAKGLIMVDEFLDIDYVEMVEKVREDVPDLEFVATTGETPDLNIKTMTMEEFSEYGSDGEDPTPDIDKDDTALILYTSGTTGQPKGVELTHENILLDAKITGDVMEVTSDDRYYVPLPLFHSFGLVLGTLTPIYFACSVVLQEVFDPKDGLSLIERHGCTMNFGVPAMFISELEELEDSGYDTSSLRSGMMGGAPCPIEVVKDTIDEMGCNVCIGYGITETSPLITLTRFDDPPEIRAESVGKPLPKVDVKIVDDDREELPPGEIGDIAVKGFNVMKKYYNKPEETEEVLDDEGWYYTSDLGKIDEDGYVYVTGRKKDMIISGGFNVYPREVEEFFYTHPKIKTCGVVGVDDRDMGEVVALVAIPKEGEDLEANELKEFAEDEIANFKVPRYVEIVDELPMTSSGKIQKFKLRETLNDKYGS